MLTSLPSRPNDNHNSIAIVNRVDARFWGFIAITVVSLLFQVLLTGYEGDDRATTPDTPAYFIVANEIQDAIYGDGKLNGHPYRTPGYPMLILIAAESAGLRLSDIVLPVRDWGKTNEKGKKLARRIFALQEILGFAIPLLTYAIVLNLGGSALLSFFVSLSYFTDMRSVAFQYVILNETLSIFLTLSVLLAFIFAMKGRNMTRIIICGFITSLTIIVRPPFVILPVVLCGAAYLIFLIEGLGIKKPTFWTVRYVAIAAILPLAWSFINFQATGHFYFSKGAVMTLQNFGARHFVQVDVDDPELLVLQKHTRQVLHWGKNRGLGPWEINAFSRSFDAVTAELKINDPMHLWTLAGRAIRIAIFRYPGEFLKGGASRWSSSWFTKFHNIKNGYALKRISQFGILGKAWAQYGYMLLGPVTIFGLLLSIPVGIAMKPPIPRAFFLSVIAFVILYSMAVTMADENEPIRHTMQIRILVNGLLIAAGLIFLHLLTYFKDFIEGSESGKPKGRKSRKLKGKKSRKVT